MINSGRSFDRKHQLPQDTLVLDSESRTRVHVAERRGPGGAARRLCFQPGRQPAVTQHKFRKIEKAEEAGRAKYGYFQPKHNRQSFRSADQGALANVP